MYTCVCNCDCVCMCVCVCVCVCVCDCVYVYVCNCDCVYVCDCVCVEVLSQLWDRGLFHALLCSCRVNHGPELATFLLHHMTQNVNIHIYTCTMYLYINVVEHPSRMRDVMGSNPAQDSSFFLLRKSLAAFGIWICLALSFMYIYLFTCSSMVIYVCRAMQSNYFRVSYEEVETSTSSRECSFSFVWLLSLPGIHNLSMTAPKNLALLVLELYNLLPVLTEMGSVRGGLKLRVHKIDTLKPGTAC